MLGRENPATRSWNAARSTNAAAAVGVEEEEEPAGRRNCPETCSRAVDDARSRERLAEWCATNRGAVW